MSIVYYIEWDTPPLPLEAGTQQAADEANAMAEGQPAPEDGV